MHCNTKDCSFLYQSAWILRPSVEALFSGAPLTEISLGQDLLAISLRQGLFVGSTTITETLDWLPLAALK